MKKIYNLFSWVVIINLMIVTMPIRAVVAGGPMEVLAGVGIEAEDVGTEVEDGEAENMEVEGEEVENGEAETGNDEADGTEIVDIETMKDLPILYIRAVNPGYKVDGINNVGEMIEIGKSSDDLILLAGVTVRYTNSSGKETVLVEFPENSYMAGETLLLRLDSAPGSELSNVTYGTTLALKAGPVVLSVGDEKLDSVCWTNKDGCMNEFVSTKPTTLKRNLTTGEFEHAEEYEPEFDVESYVVVERDDEGNESGVDDGGDEGSADYSESDAGGSQEDVGGVEENDGEEEKGDGGNENEKDEDDKEDEYDNGSGEGLKNDEEKLNEKPGEDERDSNSGNLGKCVGLQFSEILSYYVEMQAEQFIELQNVGLEAVQAEGCLIRYKGKTYGLVGEVESGGYMVRRVDDFKLTKNPTSSNVVELLDGDGETVDVVEYYNGQKKGAAWALVGYEAEEEIWRVTYAVTPGGANVYQEFRSCEDGKVINEITGNCVKVTNAITNNKEDSDNVEEGNGMVVTKTCAEGQYLNPLTGRCKKIEDEAEEKVCDEGYYLNEETGRCKKIVVETAKTCDEGYYLNEKTGRCKKIVVEEEKVCDEGYYLNEETGRCKKITVAVAKTCAEGYYLNEETGRCKKIVENNGAEYEIVSEAYEEDSSFVALYAVLAVVGVGLIYVVYEFRREIGRIIKRLVRK